MLQLPITDFLPTNPIHPDPAISFTNTLLFMVWKAFPKRKRSLKNFPPLLENLSPSNLEHLETAVEVLSFFIQTSIEASRFPNTRHHQLVQTTKLSAETVTTSWPLYLPSLLPHSPRAQFWKRLWNERCILKTLIGSAAISTLVKRGPISLVS